MVRAFSRVAPGPVTTALPGARPARGARGGSSARRPASDAFDAFIAEIFERLPRADQRRWAHVYTRGLLVTPGRKTVRRLAASASDSTTAAQALHQFVNASPWDWEPVRARLADWVARRSRPRALVIATAVLPKRGDRSCGVHRRFVPQDGRTVNCQVGLGAFLAVEQGTTPVDWRLLLPGRWAEDAGSGPAGVRPTPWRWTWSTGLGLGVWPARAECRSSPTWSGSRTPPRWWAGSSAGGGGLSWPYLMT